STVQFGFDRDFYDGNLTLNGNLYYSDRQTSAGSGVFVFTGRLLPGQGGNIFEGTTSQYWTINSMPNRRCGTDQQVARWNFGANGNIGEKWRWSSAVGRSRDEFTTLYYNGAISSFNSAGFNALVDQGLNLWAGDIAAANSRAMLEQLIIDPFDA